MLCTGQTQHLRRDLSSTEAGRALWRLRILHDGPLRRSNPHHLKIKADIELGGGLLEIEHTQTIDDALRSVGFEVLETRDLTLQTGPSIPWYQPLVGSGLSLAAFRGSRVGRWVTHNTLRALETLHIVPQGTVQVSRILNLCADAMIEAGRLGIFSPMYFIHARKPA